MSRKAPSGPSLFQHFMISVLLKINFPCSSANWPVRAADLGPRGLQPVKGGGAACPWTGAPAGGAGT